MITQAMIRRERARLNQEFLERRRAEARNQARDAAEEAQEQSEAPRKAELNPVKKYLLESGRRFIERNSKR